MVYLLFFRLNSENQFESLQQLKHRLKSLLIQFLTLIRVSLLFKEINSSIRGGRVKSANTCKSRLTFSSSTFSLINFLITATTNSFFCEPLRLPIVCTDCIRVNTMPVILL